MSSDPQVVFQVCAVASLPLAVLLPRRGEDEGLPDACVRTIPIWRRRFRQQVPRRGSRDCCWFHGGDWHVVSGLAVRLLSEVVNNGEAEQDEIEVTGQMLDGARAEDLTAWEREAFESLLYFPISVEDGEYINGRHRSSAMMAAGVRATVVQSVLWNE